MASTEPDNAVHLKNAQALDKQFALLAGFACLVILPISASIIAQGDWGGLLLLAVPLGIVVLGKWLDRLTPEDHAVLYPDRMELPGYGTRKTVFYWSEVTGIRWPTARGRKRNPDVRIKVPRAREGAVPWIVVSLRPVSPADRVKLIRYLRERGAEVEQEGWPRFCLDYAVPSVEACQRAEGVLQAGGERDRPDSSPAPFLQRSAPLIEWRPFLAGVLFPLLIVSLVSRKTWWTLSAMIALSALVNIRLVWGRWLSPFTEICLGFAGALFVFGLPAPTGVGGTRARCDPRAAACSLGVVLFVLPLLGNAMAFGWIPNQFAEWIARGGFLLLFLPILIEIQRQKRRERQRAPELEADALRRWAVYESTGRLPESELPNEGGRVSLDPTEKGRLARPGRKV